MDEELDHLAFRFFKLFAQYESALKEQGTFVVRRGEIKVDWDAFANTRVGSGFLENLGADREAAEYILSTPPMRQIVNHEQQIVWDAVGADDRSVQALFGHICRMRNNLYHGAKFKNTWFDPERSQRLLSSGLIVLERYRSLVGI